jgi:hypothetical protein
MIAIVVGGLLGLAVLGLTLMFLVALPLLLVGLALRTVLWGLLLPFRLLGLAFGLVGGVLGALFQGAFALLSLAGAAVLVVLLIVLFPVGLVLLGGLLFWGLFRLLSPGAAVGAA